MYEGMANHKIFPVPTISCLILPLTHFVPLWLIRTTHSIPASNFQFIFAPKRHLTVRIEYEYNHGFAISSRFHDFRTMALLEYENNWHLTVRIGYEPWHCYFPLISVYILFDLRCIETRSWVRLKLAVVLCCARRTYFSSWYQKEIVQNPINLLSKSELNVFPLKFHLTCSRMQIYTCLQLDREKNR